MQKNLSLFFTGSIVYPMMEIFCRGKTDFSMALAGGVCLCLINNVCNSKLKEKPIAVKCFAGSGIITAVEFLVGVFVNIILKLDVWDYSHLPLNIMGQICLPFSVLWFFLTIPAMQICVGYDKLKVVVEKRR